MVVQGFLLYSSDYVVALDRVLETGHILVVIHNQCDSLLRTVLSQVSQTSAVPARVELSVF